MKPPAAVELFNNGSKHTVKYSTYTGDKDSTAEAHIRQKVGYMVENLSDIVHMKRSLTTHPYNLKKCKISKQFHIIAKGHHISGPNAFPMLWCKTKATKKKSKKQLNALSLMLSETIQNATVVGVDTKAI